MIRCLLVLGFAFPALAADPELPAMPKPVTSFGAATSDGFAYVYGGHAGKAHNYSTETTLGQFLRLSIANPAKWEELPGGPIVQGTAVVAHGGQIYRIGGMQPKNGPTEKSDIHSIASADRFDPRTKKWQSLPDMPEGRSSHDAVVIGDKIFVAGGWKMNGAGKESDWLDKALVLDLAKEPLKWEAFEQPFKRRALTMAAYDGRVYVIGGLTSEGGTEKTVNVYDPVKKSWSKGTELPGDAMNGFSPAACVLDGKLYVNPADGKVYRLTDKGSWENVASVKTPRIVHRVIPFGKNQMLVLGGSGKGAIVGLVETVSPK